MLRVFGAASQLPGASYLPRIHIAMVVWDALIRGSVKRVVAAAG